MPRLYDITEWYEQSWWNTGGTRDKKIYLNPEDGELYYFKQSFKKGQRDYKYEFWSEIIASEIGKLLGFDILPYDIAIRGNIIGCISKSMINPASEELIEGGKYLQAFDNNFNPENIKERNKYTFQLIRNSLDTLGREKHIKDLVKVIIFDALIGNSDRHQENWAIINIHSRVSNNIKEIEEIIEKKQIESLPNWIKNFFNRIFVKSGKIRPEFQTVRLMLPQNTRFAPIYDSGCSFGRELEDERVKQLLENDQEIEKYITKGLAEIHWDGNKIGHFELIVKLISLTELKSFILEIIKKVIEQFDSEKLEKLVLEIDKELIDSGNTNSFPKERKDLVLKLLTLRFNKLREIYSQYK
jgi:hypothetical protein